MDSEPIIVEANDRNISQLPSLENTNKLLVAIPIDIFNIELVQLFHSWQNELLHIVLAFFSENPEFGCIVVIVFGYRSDENLSPTSEISSDCLVYNQSLTKISDEFVCRIFLSRKICLVIFSNLDTSSDQPSADGYGDKITGDSDKSHARTEARVPILDVFRTFSVVLSR